MEIPLTFAFKGRRQDKTLTDYVVCTHIQQRTGETSHPLSGGVECTVSV